jgi:hypothetical protein
MVGLRTKLLTVAFVVGIAATGATLAAGITNTAGDGVVDVNHEPLYVDDVTFDTESDNGEQFDVNDFTTAEGADVFEMEVTDIDGGNDFNVTTSINNTADHSLYLVIEASTPDSIILNGVSDLNDDLAQDIVEVEDGVFVAELAPDTAAGFNTADLDFDYTVANDADANAVHELGINLEYEERSPGQVPGQT